MKNIYIFSVLFLLGHIYIPSLKEVGKIKVVCNELINEPSSGFFEETIMCEEPFPEEEEIFYGYEPISWTEFILLKSGLSINVKIDGFLRVEKIANLQGFIYQYYLFKSEEDRKFDRIQSSISLEAIPQSKFISSSKEYEKNPLSMNGKYCVVEGTFIRLPNNKWIGICSKINTIKVYQ